MTKEVDPREEVPEVPDTPEETVETQSDLAKKAVEQQYVSYRKEAENIKAGKGRDGTGEVPSNFKPYNGEMTHEILRLLEPLLYEPTPPRYIKHTPKKNKAQGRNEGLPFDTTGLRSMQIQVDRFNDILGLGHWRYLLHYERDGSICKCVIIIGNDLQWARLDENGGLVPYTVIGNEVEYAYILSDNSGWGGHRAQDGGNTYKGAETNAFKRCAAHFGPGADVYRIDYDPDVLAIIQGKEGGQGGYAPEAAQPAQRRQIQNRTERPADVEPNISPEDALAMALLIRDSDDGSDELRAARVEAHDKMLVLVEAEKVEAHVMLKFLARAKEDPRQLRELVERAERAAAGPVK